MSSGKAPKRPDQLKLAVSLIQAANKIMVVCGAGISVACGIPDFRSPGTGLYSRLQKFNLPHPTAMFELDYLKRRPRPFYTLSKDIYPDKFNPYKPSYTHCFLKLLEQKNKLFYVVTQNIDDIELHAKVSPQLVS